MSIQVDAALKQVHELVEEAEKKMIDQAFKSVQKDQKIEELTNELALAEMKIEEQAEALRKEKIR